MKKLFALAAVAGVVFLLVTKLRGRQETDLWHEAISR
ncbi:DLW-39 family protein [Pseudonocardia hispaniensis]|uniref:DLW-39 family protein n=1 Tax=Pseudonocardia hispaniensis TaxID=904933 RepID=A0ABW1J6L2_9PSEU